jgi:hypothetical protein
MHPVHHLRPLRPFERHSDQVYVVAHQAVSQDGQVNPTRLIAQRP